MKIKYVPAYRFQIFSHTNTTFPGFWVRKDKMEGGNDVWRESLFHSRLLVTDNLCLCNFVHVCVQNLLISSNHSETCFESAVQMLLQQRGNILAVRLSMKCSVLVMLAAAMIHVVEWKETSDQDFWHKLGLLFIFYLSPRENK